MAYIDLIGKIHSSTPRNYLEERVLHVDKAACSEVAKKFGYDYWDGDRKYGYGGYRYDGRWRQLAKDLIRHYGLKPGDKVLDIGCGKGYLLYDMTLEMPGLEVAGLDVSQYALDHAKEEVKSRLKLGSAVKLSYPDRSFDLVVSINTLHNLYLNDLFTTLKEIERVSRENKKYIVMDSFRNDRERVSLLYWQLTCVAFYTPQEWQWIFDQAGYRGDHGLIYYE